MPAHAVNGGIVGLLRICLPLVGVMRHVVENNRFNQSLVFDPVAYPALAAAEVERSTEAAQP